MQKLRQININIENSQTEIAVMESVRIKLKDRISQFKIVYETLRIWE